MLHLVQPERADHRLQYDMPPAAVYGFPLICMLYYLYKVFNQKCFCFMNILPELINIQASLLIIEDSDNCLYVLAIIIADNMAVSISDTGME